MKNIDQKKLELLNIFIENVPFEIKIRKVNDLIINPFYVFDVSLRLIMSSYNKNYDEVFISRIGDSYFIDPKLFSQILTDEDLKFLENDEILLKKYQDIPKRFMVKRLCDDKYTIGYAVIYLEDESLLNDNKQLLEIGVKALEHEMRINGFSNSVNQVVFSRILDGSLTDTSEIKDALEKIQFSVEGEKRLVVIKTNSTQQLSYILSSMEDKHEYFVYKNDVLCFVQKNRDDVKEFLIELEKQAKEALIKSGISGIFEEINELPNAYSQALEAIEIGSKYSPNDTRLYYGDFRIISLFRRFDREELRKAVDRKLRKVIKYDAENNTAYFNDLKAYFDAGRNINKAADLLFVHKNSMYYRLEKIKSLFDIDVEDENSVFLIELSIKILDLLENF